MADVKRLSLLHQVATLYYEKGLKKYEIANKIRQSSTQVGLLLKEAQQAGIVVINVDLPRFTALQESLKIKFGLRDAIVVPYEKDLAALRDNLSKATAVYFETIAKDGVKIAIGGGYLTYKMIERLEEKMRNIEIYPTALIGHDDGISHIDPSVLVNLLWAKCGLRLRKAHNITVSPPEPSGTSMEINTHYAQVKKNPIVQRFLSHAADADVIITGIGCLKVDSGLGDAPAKPKNLAESLRISHDELTVQGAIGDIVYSFFDSSGKTRPEWNVFPSIGIENLQKLSRRKNKKVIVTAGFYKQRALQCVLQTKMCNVLVTDARAAEWLLA